MKLLLLKGVKEFLRYAEGRTPLILEDINTNVTIVVHQNHGLRAAGEHKGEGKYKIGCHKLTSGKGLYACLPTKSDVVKSSSVEQSILRIFVLPIPCYVARFKLGFLSFIFNFNSPLY
ncbi:hypothetical protein L6452_01215 [Arctium lappa]|uniref:Uncharacterized protein n=1 Tax=Arctium lappa TaxID=4217 RepID=A0ACB9FFH6_ARCLA|nr:hypothetical protein L6452_01215 [Arctium lappa]